MPTPEQNSAGSKRILVVDDSNVVRKVVSRMLMSKGYSVTVCSSGEEAFTTLLAEQFDLVVSDVVMGALSGIQLCRLVRSDPDTATTPVILLTAAYDPRSRFWGAHSGADACIAKEAMTAELPPTVERLLAEHRTVTAPTDLGAGRTVDPLARLSQVLDSLLFQAVVSAEARRILEPGHDRATFFASLFALASQVTDYAYLVVHLEGPGEPAWAVHVRGGWPAQSTPEALAALGIKQVGTDAVHIVRTDALPLDGENIAIHAGERSTFQIQSLDQQLGQLVAFGGHKRLAMADQETLAPHQ
ncbi:MAG: response regulator [Polyangiales bacterium]